MSATNLSTFPGMLDWMVAPNNTNVLNCWRLTGGNLIGFPSMGTNASVNAWFNGSTLSWTSGTVSNAGGPMGGGVVDSGTQSWRVLASVSSADAFLNIGTAPAIAGVQRKARIFVGTFSTTETNVLSATLTDGSAAGVSVNIPSGGGASYYADFTYTGGSNTTLVPVLQRTANETGELHWMGIIYYV
jgi:hypothetical protein